MPIIAFNVVNPRTVPIPLAGPGGANRLFVMTGIAEIGPWDNPDDRLRTDTVEIDLSFWHRGILFAPAPTDIAAVATPSSFHGSDDADDMSWGVDAVTGDISAAGRLRLRASMAIQGQGSVISRVAYHVYVRTSAVTLKRISITPNDVQLAGHPVPLDISLLLEQPAPPGGQPVALTVAGDPVGLHVPETVVVPAGTTFVKTTGSVGPNAAPGFHNVSVVARTAVNELIFALTVGA